MDDGRGSRIREKGSMEQGGKEGEVGGGDEAAGGNAGDEDEAGEEVGVIYLVCQKVWFVILILPPVLMLSELTEHNTFFNELFQSDFSFQILL